MRLGVDAGDECVPAIPTLIDVVPPGRWAPFIVVESVLPVVVVVGE